jgi:hypothetical protein
MTLPALLFGFLLSTLLGAVFHLWKGGGAGRLLMDLVLAWMGFWVGQWAGDILGLSFARLGPLQLATATATAVIFLLVGHFLSLDPENNNGRG